MPGVSFKISSAKSPKFYPRLRTVRHSGATGRLKSRFESCAVLRSGLSLSNYTFPTLTRLSETQPCRRHSGHCSHSTQRRKRRAISIRSLRGLDSAVLFTTYSEIQFSHGLLRVGLFRCRHCAAGACFAPVAILIREFRNGLYGVIGVAPLRGSCAPTGLASSNGFPTAHAAGCILAPLRGFHLLPSENSFDHLPFRDTIRPQCRSPFGLSFC